MSDAPLFVPLAGEPWHRFARGSKTVEVRQEGLRWGPKHVREGRPVRLRLGYSSKEELLGVVGRVAHAPCWDALPAWAQAGADVRELSTMRARKPRFFDPSKPLVAFEVKVAQAVSR